jgi:hypothetical protein
VPVGTPPPVDPPGSLIEGLPRCTLSGPTAPMMTPPLSSPGVVALAWTAAPPVDALPGWVAMFTVQPVWLVQAMRLAWTRYGALPPMWPAAHRTAPPSNRPHSSVGGARRLSVSTGHGEGCPDREGVDGGLDSVHVVKHDVRGIRESVRIGRARLNEPIARFAVVVGSA